MTIRTNDEEDEEYGSRHWRLKMTSLEEVRAALLRTLADASSTPTLKVRRAAADQQSKA